MGIEQDLLEGLFGWWKEIKAFVQRKKKRFALESSCFLWEGRGGGGT